MTCIGTIRILFGNFTYIFKFNCGKNRNIIQDYLVKNDYIYENNQRKKRCEDEEINKFIFNISQIIIIYKYN